MMKNIRWDIYDITIDKIIASKKIIGVDCGVTQAFYFELLRQMVFNIWEQKERWWGDMEHIAGYKWVDDDT